MSRKISEVFTPRNPQVNEDMYVQRESLEKELTRSVMGSMHSFLFGESGNGKSWLYKKVFKEINVNYAVANCARASMKGSITEEIRSVCLEPGYVTQTGYMESKSAGIKAVGTAELKNQRTFALAPCDDLLEAFEAFGNRGKSNQRSVIVLDNVETIIDNNRIMKELADIIVLLDDERFAEEGIKILLVGLPNQVIQFYASMRTVASVGNRVDEIPRVDSFSESQVNKLVDTGFNELLGCGLSNDRLSSLSAHLYYITLGVPQRVHEYCEQFAYKLEEHGWEYDPRFMQQVDQEWLSRGFREMYAIIEGYLNSDETAAGRRNQVIYALTQNPFHEIDTNKIGKTIAREFPKTKPLSNSGIGKVLASLSKGNHPLLYKNSHNAGYSFTDPRFIMCSRAMLYKDLETEAVRKKVFLIS